LTQARPRATGEPDPVPAPPNRRERGDCWLWLGAGVALCVVVTVWSFARGHTNLLAACLVGLSLIGAAHRSLPVVAETGFVLWLASDHLGAGLAGHLPLFAVLLMYLAHRVPSIAMQASMLPAVTVWFVSFARTPGAHYSFYGMVVAVSCFVSLALFTANSLGRPRAAPRRIDMILNSASGNTAHYAQAFAEGARRGGAAVIVHRFHDYRDFAPDLTGDALVLAFPVYGWKPPWPLLWYMVGRLPRGRGKPAFVLYTAAGGPENVSLIAWIVLRLKGYRYAGRSWAIYPVNIATFRLGPSKFWRWLDTLVPLSADVSSARQQGEEFARSVPTGHPLLVWPLGLFLIGLILDNPWVNVVLYRNHAWRRRCRQCKLCIEFCPARRLSMVGGVPRPRGTCTLCLGCVNLCPTNAMQMTAWTEYGNPYRPRWPELTVLKERLRQTAGGKDASR